MSRPSPLPGRAPPSPRTSPARPPSSCTASSQVQPRRSSSPLRLPTPPPSPVLYRIPHARLSSSPPVHRPPSPASSTSRTPRSHSPTTPIVVPRLEVHGDSFASVFSLLGARAKVFKYKGASARGLNNPHSKLQVARQLIARLESAKPAHVLLQFGNVDLLINHCWQLKARGSDAASPQDWVEKVVSDYQAFLHAEIVPLAKRTGMKKIYIAAASPPIVEDRYLEAMAEKYLEKEAAGPLPPLRRSPHPHDLATRSAMVKRFNALMGAFCVRYDCLAFVDISRHLVDPHDPLRVASEFVDPVDPTNIHLLWEPTLPIWVRALPPLASLASTLAHPEHAARLARSREAYTTEKRERVRRRSSFGGAPWVGV